MYIRKSSNDGNYDNGVQEAFIWTIKGRFQGLKSGFSGVPGDLWVVSGGTRRSEGAFKEVSGGFRGSIGVSRDQMESQGISGGSQGRLRGSQVQFRCSKWVSGDCRRSWRVSRNLRDASEDLRGDPRGFRTLQRPSGYEGVSEALRNISGELRRYL